MNNIETKVICPKCGAEIAISEHEHVTVGLAVGRDSNLGTVALPLANNERKGRMTANEKLEKLKAAGVDISSLFAMKGNDTNLFKLSDGELEVVGDDDPIFQQIVREGTVPNRRLFRRWVMGQTFRMMAMRMNTSEYAYRRGAKWMWEVIVNEFKTQAKMYQNDPELFEERNRFFNAKILKALMCDYVYALHTIPGVYFKASKTICDSMVLKGMLDSYADALEGKSPEQVYHLAQEIAHALSHVRFTKLRGFYHACSAFVSAFDKAGGYYTMQNLILFHDCVFFTGDGKPMTKIASMIRLNQIDHSDLVIEMARLIAINNIDIKAKMAEWRRK